jgi:hypothetical protein
LNTEEHKAINNGDERINITVTIDSARRLGLTLSADSITFYLGDTFLDYTCLNDGDDKLTAIHIATRLVSQIFRNSLRIDKTYRGGYLSSTKLFYKPDSADPWRSLSGVYSNIALLLLIFPKKIASEIIQFKQQ